MRRCVGLLGRVTDRTPDFVRAVEAPPHGAVAADDEFLAGVCHRVRTPLNGILGSLELLLGEDISDEARELAAAAFESARDLHRVFESELQAEFEPMVEPAVGAVVQPLGGGVDDARRSLSMTPFDLGTGAVR